MAQQPRVAPEPPADAYDAELDAWWNLQPPDERRRFIAWWNAKSLAEQRRLLDEPGGKLLRLRDERAESS